MSEARVPVGAVLDDKWRVEGLLGEGGMGAVYAATHVRNGARVAVKVLHAEVARVPSQRERFLHEGYAANKVGHPGVVRVIDDGTTREGVTYLVMERLEGASLEAVAEQRGGALPIDLTLHYALRWLEVMSAAHERGIVHRDLKPENVFVCSDGSLRVLDFGIARVKEAVSQVRLTTTGVPLGTPAYMPPEQAMARWEKVDARSDVYSIGASIFCLITGRLVHDAETVPEMLVAVSTRQATPIRAFAPGVPPAVAAVIDRALAHRPEDRFADAGAMLTALREALIRGFDASHGALAAGGVPDGDATLLRVADATPGPSVAALTGPGAGVTLPAGPVGRHTASPVSTGSPRPAPRSSAVTIALAAVAGLALTGGVAAFVLRSPSSPRALPHGSAEESASTEERPGGPEVTLATASSEASASAGRPESAPSPSVGDVVAGSSALASGSATASASAQSAAGGQVTARATARPTSGRKLPPPPTAAKPCVRDEFSQRCK